MSSTTADSAGSGRYGHEVQAVPGQGGGHGRPDVAGVHVGSVIIHDK